MELPQQMARSHRADYRSCWQERALAKKPFQPFASGCTRRRSRSAHRTRGSNEDRNRNFDQDLWPVNTLENTHVAMSALRGTRREPPTTVSETGSPRHANGFGNTMLLPFSLPATTMHLLDLYL